MAAEAEATREARAKVGLMMMLMMLMGESVINHSNKETMTIAAAGDDDINYQVIAAEGENSAAQALRNASEVDFEFLPQ